MKINIKFKEFQKIVEESGTLSDKTPIEDGDGDIVNSIFTTSEEMDIKDMIKSGEYTFDEMLDIIKQWKY